MSAETEKTTNGTAVVSPSPESGKSQAVVGNSSIPEESSKDNCSNKPRSDLRSSSEILLANADAASTKSNIISHKSATLTLGNNNNPNSTSGSSSTNNNNSSGNNNNSNSFTNHARNNLRRSFTLPRGLLLRKSGQTGPASENVNGSFVRNIFLTLVRSKSTRRSNKPSRDPSAPLTNGHNGDSNSTLPNNSGLPPGFVPGAVGLKNQGNTCFINAIIQCLSHTDALAKYLVTDAYKSDLRRKHWIKNGKGEVTEELASVLKSTWLRQNTSVLEEVASRFKSAIEKGAIQWRGSEQHDAQEFFLWLLDRLHEDLNQAASNKYKPVKNNFGRPDEQVAAEALANHLRCNNSIIQDIFGAQFRSSLTCPGCGRQSATFDPFLCVSLPIPQAKQEVAVYVNIIYLSQQPRLVKLGLSVSSNADIKELKQLLSADTSIEEDDILLTEIDGEGFHRTFTETQLVSALSNNDAVYCIETPQIQETNENDGAFLMITWTNILVTNDGNTRVRFGSPYVSQIARETGFVDLQKILLKEMAAILQPGVLVAEQKDPVFSIRVLDGSTEGSLVNPLVEHPLYTESVEDALSLCDEDVPPHIKIHLEWTSDCKDRIIFDDAESVEEHSSVAQTRLKHSEESVTTVTLGECFDLYTKAEQLSAEDSWHCPHCNRKEQGTLKMIGLWTAPQVLVVHLKRFRQTTKGRHTATKISSVVDFPVEGLDLVPHVTKRNKGPDGNAANGGLSQASSPMNGCFGLGSWKNRASFKKQLASTNYRVNSTFNGNHQNGVEENGQGLTYDLYAVCNHHGKDVLGGHYTAYCKNPVDGSWWSFDDTRVSQLSSPIETKTASAYILFYQRRSFSGGGLTNHQPLQHWCRSLLKKHHKIPALVNSNSNTTTEVIPKEISPWDPTNGLQQDNSVQEEDRFSSKDSNFDAVNEKQSNNNTANNCNNSNSHNQNAANLPKSVSMNTGASNGYQTNGVLSKSSSSGSSSAPLARMEDIAIGLSLGLPKEFQIESTV